MPTTDPMKMNKLFGMALGLASPWQIAELKFDPEETRLDIEIDFAPGSSFPCPECGESCKVHDANKQTWQHLNFFQHMAYLHARQPRMQM